MKNALVSLLSLCILAATLCAHAGKKSGKIAQARSEFERGVTAFEAGHLTEALDAFQSAYTLSPTYRILFNIAQTQAELGRPHDAMATFQAYLAEGGDEISKKRRTRVQAEIVNLRAQIGYVRVSGPEGARVWLDGEPAGVLPLAAPVRLPAGNHRLVVKHDDGRSCQKDIFVAAEQTTPELCAVLESPSAVAASVDADLEVETGGSGLPRAVPWIAAGTTVAALAAAAVSAVKTAGINNSLRSNCTGGVCPPGQESNVTALPKWAAATDGLFIATAVLSAATVALFLEPWKKEAPPSESEGELSAPEEPLEPASVAGETLDTRGL